MLANLMVAAQWLFYIIGATLCGLGGIVLAGLIAVWLIEHVMRICRIYDIFLAFMREHLRKKHFAKLNPKKES